MNDGVEAGPSTSNPAPVPPTTTTLPNPAPASNGLVFGFLPKFDEPDYKCDAKNAGMCCVVISHVYTTTLQYFHP